MPNIFGLTLELLRFSIYNGSILRTRRNLRKRIQVPPLILERLESIESKFYLIGHVFNVFTSILFVHKRLTFLNSSPSLGVGFEPLGYTWEVYPKSAIRSISSADFQLSESFYIVPSKLIE